MKRSEMLLLIVNQLHFLDGRFSGYVKKASEEELKRADVILTTLETAGMLPPPYTFKQKVVNNPTGNTISVTDYEWEDEDEYRNN